MRFLPLIVLAAAVAGAHAGRHTVQAAADEVTSLPGWAGTLPSKWFSGMLPTAPDMFSHYIYVEREVWVWRGVCVCTVIAGLCRSMLYLFVRYPCRIVCCRLTPHARA